MVTLSELRKQLEDLKTIREREIESSPSALRNELKMIYAKMDRARLNMAELNEALAASSKVSSSIDIVYRNMDKAKDWGNMDMLNSKSTYYKSMKHNSIDRAMSELSRSQLLLRYLNKELEDIGYEKNRLSLQLDRITRFPGVIFDNLISDWIVQNKIKSVLSTLANILDDVRLIVKSINKDISENQHYLQLLEDEKDILLENN